jgi:mRNA interferase HigB
MKVRLIKRRSIENFANQFPGSRNYFRNWLTLLKMADWNAPGDITKTFGSADLLGNGSNRVVFDIAGNHYRMLCKYSFGHTEVHLYIKWIGTHAAYTKICKGVKQYTISDY